MTSTALLHQKHLMIRLMGASQPPDVVYHYTTAAGLLGICTSKKIWATNIRYLNDSEEFRYTLDLAATHLASLDDKITGEQEKLLISEWKETLAVALQVRVYVASFSENGDQLSQWRAYGRGSGYAIGFTPLVLMNALLQSPHPPCWLKCIYDRDQQLENLQYATTYLLEKFAAGPIPEPPDDVTYRMGFALDFFSHLLVLAACFKHPAFEEEAEWRLILRQEVAANAAVGLRFRESGRTLAPYLEVPLGLPDSGGLRIDQVVVGPNPHMDTAVSAVSALLEQEGVTHDGVGASVIPYRDW